MILSLKIQFPKDIAKQLIINVFTTEEQMPILTCLLQFLKDNHHAEED